MHTNINIRSLPLTTRAFDALPMDQRQAIVAQDDVKNFLHELRSMKGQSRAVTGGELTIPVVFLELIAENMFRYSKLMNRVRIRNVGGQARQTIAGTVPEAVWTEMCGNLNELTFNFNQVTLDGYKVGGWIPVCNALLEDNDVNLASWIIEMLSESIGLAKDKAILYGKGASKHMPLGIVTRLAQESAPADYPANAPAWTDLHTSNIISIDNSYTGANFWAALQIAAGNTFTKYSRGQQAVFHSEYWLWSSAFETIDPGAFSLEADTDVRALTNHDTTLVLGRTTVGTLQLRVDETGLYGTILINDKDQDAVNLYERVKRGDVSQCSFGFDILQESTEYREDGITVFHLQRVKLWEVSVCTFPAYEDTGVQARMAEVETARKRKLDQWRAEATARLRNAAGSTEPAKGE